MLGPLFNLYDLNIQSNSGNKYDYELMFIRFRLAAEHCIVLPRE